VLRAVLLQLQHWRWRSNCNATSDRGDDVAEITEGRTHQTRGWRHGSLHYFTVLRNAHGCSCH